MRGRVLTVHRYPLKSAGAEELTHAPAAVEADGLEGDRRWACVDAADGTVVSAKHPRRGGRLLAVEARLAADAALVLDVPGCERTRAGSGGADAALSAWLGFAVRLVQDVPVDARLHRLHVADADLLPSWHEPERAGTEQVTAIAGARPGGRFVDFGALHLVTTGALARLARDHGHPVDARRFRANLVLELEHDPAPGQLVRLGSAELRVLLPTPRCLVPSLAQPGLDTDAGVLRTLARAPRAQLPGGGSAVCFGSYAEVVRAGSVRGGDAVEVR